MIKNNVASGSKRGNGAKMLLSILLMIVCVLPFMALGLFPSTELILNCGLLVAEVYILLCLMASLIVAIAVHEAGHLVFGLMSGYGFSSYRIFNIILIKTDDGIRLKKHSVPGTAGQCLMTPPEIIDGKMPTVLYNLGGSLLGIAVALACAAVSYFTVSSPLLSTALVALGIINAYISLTNLIPMKTEMINNDGMNAISLRKSADATESFRIQLLVNAESSKGVPIHRMPEEWFELPEDDKLTDPMVASRAYLRFARLFRAGKYEEAKRLGHYLVDNAALVGIYRGQITNDLGFIAVMEGDYLMAKHIFQRERPVYKGFNKNNLSAARTRYAYELLMRKNEIGAKRQRRIIDTLLGKLKNYAFRHEVEHEIELIALIDREYKKWQIDAKK